MKKKLSLLLALCLTLSLSALPAAALTTEQAKDLLQRYYVDEIPQSILDLDNLDDILSALGDPYTFYMSAEEYQGFLTSVNGSSVVGIGISLQSTFNNGFRVMSVLPDSPALKAGLQAGDRIIAVNGVRMKAGMDAKTYISGEAGTSVTVTVIRQEDDAQRDYTMERQSVSIPIVTYKRMDDDVGYIDCTSFGGSTAETIQKAITELDPKVSTWVLDLRQNPGGTSDAAALSAGLFTGGALMVYMRDADGRYRYIYTAESCPDLTDKPLLILTSPYSASGSELFAAAARDHGFGIAIGQRTYGKGIAQSVFDEKSAPKLFQGDALKVTTDRFFSPSGASNHIVGVLPTLLISANNTDAAALILSEPEPMLAANHLKLELTDFTLYIDVTRALYDDRVDAFTEILEALPPQPKLYQGSNSKTWTQVQPADLAAQLGLDFHSRSFSDVEGTPYQTQIDTLCAYDLLSGYRDGTFRPQQTVTRAEFCAMLASALNLPASAGALTFSDVAQSAWYAEPVSALVARGFVSGYADGTFRPDDTITYEEMITVLSSVAAWFSMDGYAVANSGGVTISQWENVYYFQDWAQESARNLTELGVSVHDLEPAQAGTREVAAKLLCDLMSQTHLLWE